MTKYAVVLLLAGLAAAQTKPADPVPDTIVYEFKNVDINRAMAVASFAVSLLNNRVQIHVDNTFKTAIIRSNVQGFGGPALAADMAKAEELLKRYDLAPPAAPQADFVAYLVRASMPAPTPSPAPAPAGNQSAVRTTPIPPVLQDAITEMKKTFPYSDYSLLDIVETEVRNKAAVQNMFPGQDRPIFYEISYDNMVVSNDRKTVTVNPFKFTVRIPVGSGSSGTKYEDTGITTEVAIHEGQSLVLGKVRRSNSDPADVFLILTVKLH